MRLSILFIRGFRAVRFPHVIECFWLAAVEVCLKMPQKFDSLLLGKYG